jgi:hypothetical protein
MVSRQVRDNRRKENEQKHEMAVLVSDRLTH